MDEEDAPSSGIYKRNLESMARKKGIDTAYIDNSLTYGENKSALHLEAGEEYDQETAMRNDLAKKQRRIDQLERHQDAPSAEGIEDVDYLSAEEAAKFKNSKETKKATGQEPIRDVQYFSPSEVKSVKWTESKNRGLTTQKVIEKSSQVAKGMVSSVQARNVQRGTSTAGGRTQPSGGMFGSEHGGLRSMIQGDNQLGAALMGGGRGSDPLTSMLMGRGGGGMFGSGEKKPRQRYAVIMEGNTVRRVPVQDVQAQQDPLTTMLSGGGGNPMLTRETSPRRSREAQNPLLAMLTGSGRERGGHPLLQENRGRSQHPLMAMLGSGESGAAKLLGRGATHKNPFGGNSSMQAMLLGKSKRRR